MHVDNEVRILGLDPGLRRAGWGVISLQGSRLVHIAHGVITPPEQADLSFRLLFLFEKTAAVVAQFRPDEAAIEESFVNTNASSTLKLGHARAAIMLAPAQAGLGVAEYAARYVKKSVVGTGAAEKAQVQFMIRRLLPSVGSVSTDEADALAVAIAHAHSRAKKPTVRELRVESAFGGNQ